MKKKRMVFDFDPVVFLSFQNIKRKLGFSTFAAFARAAISLIAVFQQQAREGYSQIILEDPDTGKRRFLIVDLINE